MQSPLEKLKAAGLRTINPGVRAATPFFFELIFEPEPTVVTVNAAGNEYHPDAKNYSGYVADALRMCEDYRADGNFDWFGKNDGKEDIDRCYRVSLAREPFLLYKIAKCPNIVTENMSPVRVADGETRLTLRIIPCDGQSDMLQASLMAADDNGVAPVRLVTEDFAVASNTLYPVLPVGGNYAHIGIFMEPFAESALEAYLALFLTYFTNISIDCSGRKVVISDEPVHTVPTLVIEKFDTDNALYLRLVNSVASEDDLSSEDLNHSYVVDATSGKNIIARPVSMRPVEDETKEFLKLIRKFAPDKEARAEVFACDNLFIIPEATASDFLINGLPSLLKSYRITGLDKLKEYKLRPVVPKLNVRFSSGIDFLEGTADVEIEGQTLSLAELLEQYRKQKYVLLADGTHAVIDSNYISRIERLFKQRRDGSVEVSFFDLPDIEQLLDGRMAESPTLQRPRKFYSGFNNLASEKLNLPDVKATLRSYQIEGVKWLKYLYDNNMGGCLADDMGLGKTLQVIAMLSLIYPAEPEPALIVMPRSLLFNWASEMQRFAPQLSVYTYYGQQRSLDEAMKHQVILTTYAMVRNDVEKFAERRFHIVVLDESQTIKNMAALQTRSIMMLKADKRFALSGTPIENNLSELYSLYHFLNPAMLGTFDDFNRSYVQPMQRDGDRDALESLRRKIFPFMLRRLKKDVLTDLPERIDQTMYVEPDAEHARFYEDRRRYYLEKVREAIATEGIHKSQFVMFQALSELRRIASVPDSLTDGRIRSPKIELLAERIESAVDNGHKVVVFFNFIAGIELLVQKLESSGIECETMTGSTHNRSAVVNRFQTDTDCKVLIMTLKTGGVGLNLTAADTVFIAEPWWNKAAEEQAVNRLHRIGQKATVFCYSIIVKGTIEEKIRELQQRKADLFNDVIGSDEASSKQLSEDDINFILS